MNIEDKQMPYNKHLRKDKRHYYQQPNYEHNNYSFAVISIDNTGDIAKYLIKQSYLNVKFAYSERNNHFLVAKKQKAWIIVQINSKGQSRRQLILKESQPLQVITNNCKEIVFYNNFEIYLVYLPSLRIKKVPLLMRKGELIKSIFYKKDSIMILLNSGEIMGWGNNRQNQLGLLLHTFYQKPELIFSKSVPIINVINVFFMKNQTILMTDQGDIYVCQKIRKYQLNFEGFKNIAKDRNIQKEEDQYSLLFTYLAINNSKYSSLFTNCPKIQSISEDIMCYCQNYQNVIWVNRRTGNICQLKIQSVIDAIFCNQYASIIVNQFQDQHFHIILQKIIKFYSLQNFELKTPQKDVVYNHPKSIQTLRKQSQQQKTLIQLQYKLINKLQNQSADQQTIAKQEIKRDQPQIQINQQLITSLAKISRLRRLLELLQI